MRKGVKASAQGDDPVVAPQMMERLQEIVLLDADAWSEFSSAIGRENPVALGSQEPHQFNPSLGVLYILSSAHGFISNLINS